VPPGAYARLVVADSGVGIDESIKPRIFEPFFTTKSPDKGTGLGLATVYGIVKQAGGYITVSSERQKGARFEIFFPQVAGRVEVDAPRKALELALTGDETILLVEDAKSMREISRTFLEGAGYKVLECATAAEALATAKERQGSIDLLMTDLILPGMNGRQLAEKLAALRPSLKVLYTSGYADDALLRGEPGPRRDFVAKPYTRKALLQKVRELLDRDQKDAAAS
jgi:CheY-like chemotaxis protein